MSSITTRNILTVMLILSWIIFVGLCVEAGGFITNAVFVVVNPGMIGRLYQQVDLSALLQYHHRYFFAIHLIMSVVTVLKAVMFYCIISLLHNKKLDISQPFNNLVRRFLFSLSGLALCIGLISASGIKHVEWLQNLGVRMPDTKQLQFGGADVWLFMAVILFVIAQIFKRGIEIQNENDLTV